MRLDNQQKYALEEALRDINAEVYLFGSRTDDTKKGGDVDILVFSPDNSLTLSMDISKKYFMNCEEKIDVIVMDKNNLSEEQKAFLNTLKLERLK